MTVSYVEMNSLWFDARRALCELEKHRCHQLLQNIFYKHPVIRY